MKTLPSSRTPGHAVPAGCSSGRRRNKGCLGRAGFSGLLLPAALLMLFAPAAFARSILEGLELVEGAKGGVEILSVSPGSPASAALLQAGDRLTSIGGEKIRSLDDYVIVSKKYKTGERPVAVGYRRGEAEATAELTLKSSPLREKWGVGIVPLKREGPERQSAEYWLALAKKEMRAHEGKGEDEAGPAEHGREILYLFTALDANPDDLTTADLIAARYVRLGSLYRRRADTKKAVWCMRRALLLYGNCAQKAGGMQELVLVRNGLRELHAALAD